MKTLREVKTCVKLENEPAPEEVVIMEHDEVRKRRVLLLVVCLICFHSGGCYIVSTRGI